MKLAKNYHQHAVKLHSHCMLLTAKHYVSALHICIRQ